VQGVVADSAAFLLNEKMLVSTKGGLIFDREFWLHKIKEKRFVLSGRIGDSPMSA